MSHRLVPPPPEATARLLRAGILAGGLAGALGVSLLAYSAHAGTSPLLRSAAEMLLFHAPALIAMGALAQARRIPLLPVAFLLMSAGLLLFCGDLARRGFDGARLFPMAAPIGGVMIILGWALLALSALRVRPR